MTDNIRPLRPTYPKDKYEPFTLDELGVEKLQRDVKIMLNTHLGFALGRQLAEALMQSLLTDINCRELVELGLSASPPPDSHAHDPSKNLVIAESVRRIYFNLGEQKELTETVLTSIVRGAFAQANELFRPQGELIISSEQFAAASEAILGHLKRKAVEIDRQSKRLGI